MFEVVSCNLVTNQSVTRTFDFIALTLSDLTLVAGGRATARCRMRVGALRGAAVAEFVGKRNKKKEREQKDRV